MACSSHALAATTSTSFPDTPIFVTICMTPCLFALRGAQLKSEQSGNVSLCAAADMKPGLWYDLECLM